MSRILAIAAGLGLCAAAWAQAPQLYDSRASLGEALFFDVNLSRNRTQACASCHDPETGFADPRGTLADMPSSLGDDGSSIGDRNAPTASYAAFSPRFHQNAQGKWIGGQFLDGRAADLKGQAGGPPLSPPRGSGSTMKDGISWFSEPSP